MPLPAVEQERLIAEGVKLHTICRVCNSALPAPYLNLGEQPLANALLDPLKANGEEPRYPLAVARCQNCGLSQLTVVVDPRILYTHYRFSSGISKAWHGHCETLAVASRKARGADKPGFVIDIAANDGTQLIYFKREQWRVLGVEPSDIDTVMVGTFGNQVHAKVPIIRAFWSMDIARQIKSDHGLADLVIGQNVLGHVDDVVGFLKAVKEVLAPDGKAIVEVPYVCDMIDNMGFDTIYHEHLSYWNISSLQAAANAAGLGIASHEEFPDLHGGTIRYMLAHGDESRYSINECSEIFYTTYAERVSKAIDATASIISTFANTSFLAWGASAKGVVMMNAIRNRWPALQFPAAVIDQTPEKQGFLTPGVHIPVIPPPDDLSTVDLLWVLSWNWLDGIKGEAIKRGFKGKYLVTSPNPRLI
jgi:SAM-dependent methyltransferase